MKLQPFAAAKQTATLHTFLELLYFDPRLYSFGVKKTYSLKEINYV